MKRDALEHGGGTAGGRAAQWAAASSQSPTQQQQQHEPSYGQSAAEAGYQTYSTGA